MEVSGPARARMSWLASSGSRCAPHRPSAGHSPLGHGREQVAGTGHGPGGVAWAMLHLLLQRIVLGDGSIGTPLQGGAQASKLPQAVKHIPVARHAGPGQRLASAQAASTVSNGVVGVQAPLGEMKPNGPPKSRRRGELRAPTGNSRSNPGRCPSTPAGQPDTAHRGCRPAP